MRRGPAIFVLLCLLAGAAFGAYRASAEAWRRVTGFTPASYQASRPTTGSNPLANRLVLILVDGLAAQDAPYLPSLDWLGRQGATLTLQVSVPRDRKLLYTALFTGSEPEHTGYFPGAAGPIKADSLVEAASRGKLSIGGAGSENLPAVLGGGLSNWQTIANPADFLTRSRQLIDAAGPRLVILQTSQLTRAPGAAPLPSGQLPALALPARSTPAYRDALAGLDATLADIVTHVDLRNTAVMVVGTTPATPSWWQPDTLAVPLLMAGPGVRQQYHGAASVSDLAASAAVLLGIPVPLESAGTPALSALTVDGGQADLVSQRVLASRRAYTDSALQSLGTLAAVPPEPTLQKDAPRYLATLDALIHQAQWDHWKAQLTAYWPYIGGGLLLPLLYLLVALRQPFGRPLFAGALTYAAVFEVLFFATGGRYSAAMPGLDGLRPATLGAVAACALAAMVIASIVTGYRLSRKGFKYGSYIAGASLHMALFTAVLISLPVAVAVVLTGWDFPVVLPAPGLLVWFFTTCSQVLVIGVLGILWAILTGQAARISRELWPLKEVGDPELNADKVLRMNAIKRSSQTAGAGRRSPRPTSRR